MGRISKYLKTVVDENLKYAKEIVQAGRVYIFDYFKYFLPEWVEAGCCAGEGLVHT